MGHVVRLCKRAALPQLDLGTIHGLIPVNDHAVCRIRAAPNPARLIHVEVLAHARPAAITLPEVQLDVVFDAVPVAGQAKVGGGAIDQMFHNLRLLSHRSAMYRHQGWLPFNLNRQWMAKKGTRFIGPPVSGSTKDRFETPTNPRNPKKRDRGSKHTQ